MERDASVKTQDMRVLDEMDMAVFNQESLRSYRQRMRLARPGHVWEMLDDGDFLLKIGAAGIGPDGQEHPTSAGLLMFGNEYDIVREFNSYFLDYQEQDNAGTRWAHRIVSSSGDWSGNVYDFYFRVCDRLNRDLKVPPKPDGAADEDPVRQALREALANCLVNADYYGRQGLVIVKRRREITMANPGGFRIRIDRAKSGGVSDPRNGTLSRMFHLIDIGVRAGSGIPNIYRVWQEQGWVMPDILEQLDPARTLLTLSFEKAGVQRPVMEPGGSRSAISARMKEAILVYLTDHTEATVTEIADHLGLRLPRAKEYLEDLIAEGSVVADSSRRTRKYRLKA